MSCPLPVCEIPPPAGVVGLSCEVLVDRVLGGDRAAEDELGRRVTRQLVPHCLARYRSRLGSSIDDVAQAVWLAVRHALDRWNRVGRFCGWVCAIARRVSYRFLFPPRVTEPLPPDVGATRPPPDRIERGCVQCMVRVVGTFPAEQQWVWYATIFGDPPPNQSDLGRQVEVTREQVNRWLGRIRDAVNVGCRESCY